MFKKSFDSSNKKIIGNVPLFIISMALSVILWFVIVTAEDSTVTYTTTAIKPTVIGMESLRSAGLVVAPYGELSEESLKLSGKRDDLISSMNYISVEYDLSGITKTGKVTISPSVTGASDLRIIKNNFGAVTFDIQKLETKENVPVEIKIKNEANTTDGVTIRPIPLIENVTITGTAKSIKKVKKCVCEVDLDELTSGVRFDAEFFFADEDGNILKDTPDLSSVTQKIPINCEMYREAEVPISNIILPLSLSDKYYVELISPSVGDNVLVAYKDGTVAPANIDATIRVPEDVKIEGEGEYDLAIDFNLGKDAYSTESIKARVKLVNKEINNED